MGKSFSEYDLEYIKDNYKTKTDKEIGEFLGRSEYSIYCKRRRLKLDKKDYRFLGKHPLYSIWQDMHRRCYKTYRKEYSRYGGRGIFVEIIWHDYESFYNWALANGWKKGLKLDRVDNDGPYAPWNCRFSTAKESNNNRRPHSKHKISSSKYIGVSWIKSYRKWRAGTRVNGRCVNIGSFDSEIDAAKAYNEFIINNNLVKIRKLNDLEDQKCNTSM